MIPDGVIRTAGFNLAHANKQAGEIERIILKEFQFLESLALYLHFFVSALKSMERVKGIEPSSQAWEAHVLPLNHTRV